MRPQDVLSFPSAAARGRAPAGLLGVLPSSEIFNTARGNGLPLAGVHAASLLSFALSLGCPPRCAQLQSYEGCVTAARLRRVPALGSCQQARPGLAVAAPSVRTDLMGQDGNAEAPGLLSPGPGLAAFRPGSWLGFSGALWGGAQLLQQPSGCKSCQPAVLCGAAPATKHGHICAFCLGAGSRMMLGPPPP